MLPLTPLISFSSSTYPSIILLYIISDCNCNKTVILNHWNEICFPQTSSLRTNSTSNKSSYLLRHLRPICFGMSVCWSDRVMEADLQRKAYFWCAISPIDPTDTEYTAASRHFQMFTFTFWGSFFLLILDNDILRGLRLAQAPRAYTCEIFIPFHARSLSIGILLHSGIDVFMVDQ